jgi:hypothetical protein
VRLGFSFLLTTLECCFSTKLKVCLEELQLGMITVTIVTGEYLQHQASMPRASPVQYVVCVPHVILISPFFVR